MHICNSSFKETGNNKRCAAIEQWISMRIFKDCFLKFYHEHENDKDLLNATFA